MIVCQKQQKGQIDKFAYRLGGADDLNIPSLTMYESELASSKSISGSCWFNASKWIMLFASGLGETELLTTITSKNAK